MPETRQDIGPFRTELRRLFYGHTAAAIAFQFGLLFLDFAALAYFLATTFLDNAPWIRIADVALGAILALEFLGRLGAHRHPMHYFDNASAVIDLLVILSLFLSAFVENLAFLRVLRTARLLRSYYVLGHLKRRSRIIRRNHEIFTAGLDLAVFMLIVSSIVYATQHVVNPDINNFLDAFYFTATTLTTTGYGDIVLVGPFGRLLSVAIMIIGISMFFRLAQAAFRPTGKVRHSCPQCGLQRHDTDAVHCKACGIVLNIPHDNEA